MEVSAENLIVEVGISTNHRKPSTMSNRNEKQSSGLSEIGLGLDDLIRQGARQVIQQAVEAELAQLLDKVLHRQA